MTLRDTHPSPDTAPGVAAADPARAPSPGSESRPAVGGVRPPDPAPVSGSALGLRLRIWFACLGGALVAATGLWWVAGTQVTLRPDPPQLLGWLIGVGGLGLVVGVALALWLDRGIVSHLRGVTRGIASGRVQELRGLPAAAGWGELSELTEWVQVLIARQRLSQRAGEELERLEGELSKILSRLDDWRAHDRWEPLSAAEGPAGSLARELNETFARAAEIDDQNLEAARRVRSEITGAAADAREFAVEAERGFVEATALLTTVRELQRLGGELQQAAPAPAREPIAERPALGARAALHREAVEAALGELIASSNESVEHLGAALRRVQDIAAQVQVVSQRATLVALHAVTLESRLPREERHGDELSNELRLLTGEVRSASQHADALAAEVERETRAADERMRGLRERVAPRLAPFAGPASPVAEAVGAGAGEGAPVASEPAQRLLERVREMVQDATQKGERLSAAGERTSRAADRLVRRLEEEAREVEGLMVRLAPEGRLEAEDPAETESSALAELRLLDTEGLPDTADEARDPAEPGAGRGRREERP